MTIKNLAIASLASATLVVATAGTALACNVQPKPKTIEHKIGVCHATGSKTNPYVFINVDEHAVPAHTNHQDDRDVVGAKSAADCPKPATQTPAPTPTPGQGQVLSTTQVPAQVALPTELPKTGASTAGLSALVGLPTLAVTGRAYLRSRQAK